MILYYLKVYIAAVIGFLALDAVWLGLVARGFYQEQVGFLLRDKPNWAVALGFYLLYVAGLVVLVIAPALQRGSLANAALLGAVFGLVTYATYDLTNLATVKNWPWLVTLVDLVWGTALAASVSCIGFLAGRWLG